MRVRRVWLYRQDPAQVAAPDGAPFCLIKGHGQMSHEALDDDEAENEGEQEGQAAKRLYH